MVYQNLVIFYNESIGVCGTKILLVGGIFVQTVHGARTELELVEGELDSFVLRRSYFISQIDLFIVRVD